MLKWMGSKPTKCDICNCDVTDRFYDAKTTFGPWGILCPRCFVDYTKQKLGTGFAQRYDKHGDNWVKYNS